MAERCLGARHPPCRCSRQDARRPIEVARAGWPLHGLGRRDQQTATTEGLRQIVASPWRSDRSDAVGAVFCPRRRPLGQPCPTQVRLRGWGRFRHRRPEPRNDSAACTAAHDFALRRRSASLCGACICGVRRGSRAGVRRAPQRKSERHRAPMAPGQRVALAPRLLAAEDLDLYETWLCGRRFALGHRIAVKQGGRNGVPSRRTACARRTCVRIVTEPGAASAAPRRGLALALRWAASAPPHGGQPLAAWTELCVMSDRDAAELDALAPATTDPESATRIAGFSPAAIVCGRSRSARRRTHDPQVPGVPHPRSRVERWAASAQAGLVQRCSRRPVSGWTLVLR